MVDVSLFGGDDRLASYCGLVPSNSQSGTSIDSASAARSGNKQLKNLLIFSCNSLVGTRNRFGRYYDECRSRDVAHNKALKAVAVGSARQVPISRPRADHRSRAATPAALRRGRGEGPSWDGRPAALLPKGQWKMIGPSSLFIKEPLISG
jgi:hypothetical protein